MMLLETLLKNKQVSDQARRTIKIVISKFNMLLCLVNNLLDIKMIEQNKFQA